MLFWKSWSKKGRKKGRTQLIREDDDNSFEIGVYVKVDDIGIVLKAFANLA